jgi:hypothetical protein
VRSSRRRGFKETKEPDEEEAIPPPGTLADGKAALAVAQPEGAAVADQ